MDEDKRMLRRLEAAPASMLTEWEQGAIYGFLHLQRDQETLKRLEKKLCRFEAGFLDAA